MGDFSFSFRKKPEGSGPKQPEASAAETSMQQLRACGLNLSGHLQLSDILANADAAAVEAAPFPNLLTLMGGLQEDGSGNSDDVYFIDPAWFQAEGGMALIAANLSRIAKGAIPIENPESTLSEEGLVALSFTLDGEAASWEANLNDEESGGAMQILTGLAQIAAERGEGAALAWTPIEGSGYACVFLNDQELAELGETTGMEWSRLA